MPPMMLLPLIDHAVVRGLEPATGAGAIRIRTEVSGGRLRLTIVDSGVGFAPEGGGDGIAVIRERLEALYGGDARLDLHRADEHATRAVLDLPLEARAGSGELAAGAPVSGAQR
jgi:LytS/YehU family sensor histidine kinase